MEVLTDTSDGRRGQGGGRMPRASGPASFQVTQGGAWTTLVSQQWDSNHNVRENRGCTFRDVPEIIANLMKDVKKPLLLN